MKERIVPAVALAAALTTLPACSNSQEGQEPGAQTETQTQANTQAQPGPSDKSPAPSPGPIDPHAVVVDTEATPAGYMMENLNQVIEQQQATDPQAFEDLVSMGEALPTDPPECTALAPTALSLISTIAGHPDQVAGREFSNPETAGWISTVVSSDPQYLERPDDLATCASLTKSSDYGSATYQAAPLDIGIDGADAVVAAEVTLSDSSFSPELIGEVGSTSRIAYVDLDGARFVVSASPEATAEEFTDMVNAQAAKIRQR